MKRFLVLCFLGGTPALAANVELDDAAIKEAGLDPAAVRSDLNTSIDEGLRVVDQQRFLRGMANAAAISARGMGVDYGLDVKTFVVGATIGSGVADAGTLLGRGEEDPLPAGGFSGQLSVMVGVCPGGFVPGDGWLDHLRVFVNGMAIRMPSGQPFSGSLRNIGGHVQLQLFDGADAKVGAWNGLALSAGYDSTSYELSLRKELPLETTTGGAEIAWRADGTYDIEATTGSIPLEASTAFRVLVLGVFAGVGYDIVTSTAESSAALVGPVELQASNGEDRSLGSASVSIDDAANGDPGMLRVFGGAQIRLAVVKIYGQINVADNDTVGGHLGARLVW
jgi:hypothetical protein